MFANFIFLFGLIFLTACSSTNSSWNELGAAIIKSELANDPQPFKNQNTSNIYTPGIYRNQYGQPVTLEPAGGAVPGEQLRIKPNAYGPGVHMDQYGRPVKERAWP
ncbi:MULTISPECIES: hypothetical protein [unclassified Acidovorax]|uniref:hypothetical protein n=1 Tax=unclassified Acidovorax TaxID=2684926 RepID=UPI0023DE6533|nr:MULTISPECIES: hypothetical protein [unclassified Acidovorax]GKS84946.1 hypothetical protein AVMA1855_12360 [Acidovorax sp. SUPP1855]GKS94485.1 hypothetical protein AVAK2825_08140 [Acidovorax sp. SUPP2825]